ncbi:MAG: caspase family protein [Burkholderiales bacterium]
MSEPGSRSRRRLLQATLAGSAWGLLPLRALAQVPAEAAGTMLGAALAAPRRALVIGNDRYRDSPLKNPVNDARAITAELEAADFSVTVGYDATLDEMRKRIDAFGAELARTKAVGLFYFAGHGIQLSWRNYLLPVDTTISKIDEVRDKAVDLGRLLESIGKAGNPANIVILDACRNNPFGRDFRVEQRGLSQVDAPVGTLLAYATAPGNVAIDGDGENGLYTEYLLKEIRVPDAKVEDIFKRVRLAVRRRSKGQQIPWESTSLEDDFYFQLPEELRKAAEAARRQRAEAEREQRRLDEERLRRIEAEIRAQQTGAEAERLRKAEEARQALLRAEEERLQKANAEREARERAEAEQRRRLAQEREARRRDEAERQRVYEEQLAAWEKLADSQDLAAVEQFLYRYPNGQFSELAQLRLDQLLAAQGEKRIEVVSSPDNPYSKGTVRADTGFKVGDTYVYLLTDRTKDERRKLKQVVTEVTDTEVVINNDRLRVDKLGNAVRTAEGKRFTGRQDFAVEYAIGKRWITRNKVAFGQIETDFETEYRVVARESITVRAGTFDCYKVEGRAEGLSTGGGRLGTGFAQVRGEQTYWIAPAQVRRPIIWEQKREVARGGQSPFIAHWTRQELLYFKQG